MGFLANGAGKAEAPAEVAGVVRSMQGQASINGSSLDATASLQRLDPGQTLSTASGGADLSLGRGAILKLGPGSAVKMVAEDESRTEVRLQAGRANVVVDVVPKDRLLLVDMPGGQIQIVANGLYSFTSAGDQVRVFDGEALAFPGDDLSASVKPLKIKQDHELSLGAGHLRAERFDRELAEADLIPWSGQEARDTQAYASNGTHDSGSGDAGFVSAFYGDGASYGMGSPYGGYGFGDTYGGFGLPFGYGGGFGLGLGFGYAGLGWGSPFGFGSYSFGGYPFYGGGLGFYGGVPVYGGGYGQTGVNRTPIRRPGQGPVTNPGTGAYPIPTPGRRPVGSNRAPMPGRTFGGGRLAGSFGGGSFHGGAMGGGGFHGGGGHR